MGRRIIFRLFATAATGGRGGGGGNDEQQQQQKFLLLSLLQPEEDEERVWYACIYVFVFSYVCIRVVVCTYVSLYSYVRTDIRMYVSYVHDRSIALCLSATIQSLLLLQFLSKRKLNKNIDEKQKHI